MEVDDRPKPKLPACFPHPLTDELLAKYEALAAAAPAQLKEIMQKLLVPIKMWWELPESTRTDVDIQHVLHRTDPKQERVLTPIQIRPLEMEHQKHLWDAIPWDHELEGMQKVLLALPDGVTEVHVPHGENYNKVTDQAAFDLRNAAWHLWWYVAELYQDREPLTREALGK
jgi:hypothetical protein